jgi:hypothetical protein
LKRIKTLLAPSFTVLFLGLSSLFPCQVFSSVFDLDTSALVGSTAGALSVEQSYLKASSCALMSLILFLLR